MPQRPHFVIVFLIGVTLFTFSDCPADLSERLQQSDFKLYAKPCPANDMSLSDVNGGKVSLSGYRGSVVILNFWKIDCPPCSAEKAILERIYRRHAGRGLAIVAVNLFDSGDRIKAYRSRGGFSFPFVFDPEQRFRIQQYRLGSGAPATFVVNADRQAIYEIPAVPTTYLLDRSGRIVGSSFSMVNWEEQPFSDLLESLLGSSPQTGLVARNSEDFSQAARQGSPATGSQEDAASRQRRTVDQRQGPPRSGNPTTRVAQAPSLPFQPPQAQMPSAGPPAGPMPQSVPSGTIPPQPVAAGQAAKQKPKGQAGVKQKPAQAAHGPEAYGQPKPYGGQAPFSVGSAPGRPAAGQTTQGPGPPPATLATPAPLSPSGPPTAPAGPGALAPLPPALPYSAATSRRPASAPPVAPDDEGNVMARIPEAVPPGWSGSRGTPPTGSLPAAQPVSRYNPFDGFILDSFGQPRMETRPQAGTQTQAPDAPAASALGQLNQDISALGSGIRDVFSRILPGR
jgi:peroxiredoxin